MLPDVSVLASAIAIGVLLGLLVPKRRLPDLRGRLDDLTAGRRRWLYRPPVDWSAAPASRRARLLSELDRLLELGAPVWLLARLYEDRAARATLEEAAAWSNSAAALLSAHLAGTISEEELARHLTARGLPPPAANARSTVVARRPATPIDWWAEKEELARQVTANGDGVGPPTNGHIVEAAGAVVTPPVPAVEPGLLSISIIGRFEITSAGVDLTPDLLRHQVAAYIVVYLLARTILNAKLRLPKTELADELSPGLAADKQRKRLTNRLTDMKTELPAALVSRITAGREEAVTLDLSATTIDYKRLLALAEECAGKAGLLSPELASEAEGLLASCEGEVLPIWDDLEQTVNGARGAGGEFVRELRQRAEDARVTILGALAANHLARHEAPAAIPLLERALERQPDREDMARKLRMAYLETGQHARAAEIQKAHALEA